MSNPATTKKQLPAYLVLAIIALASALALALTNAITSGPIREREMKAQREAFGSVLMAEEYIAPDGFDAAAHSVTNLVEAREGGKTIGYCVAASANGYAGPVAVTLGVDAEGTITGVKIGDGSFVETAGFGSRWLDESNWTQFKGVNAAQGGTIEALSGATVTSTAVLNASNNALAAINTVMGKDRTEPVLAFGKPAEKPVPQVTLTGDVKEGTARGFQSDVKVQLTLDNAGAIQEIVIHSADETAGFGTRCAEDAAFAAQFIGKTAPLTLGEGVDALAGATVTSKAVVEAINAAMSAPVSAPAEPVLPALTGDIKEGTAKGFQSDVQVQVTADENGAITGIVIDSAGETAGFGTRCAEEAAFAAQFIGKTAPVEVDALAGATVTSKAVMEAVNNALAPAAEATAAPAAEPTAEEAADLAEKYDLAAPALTAAAPGFMGEDVGVSLTLNEDGTIASIALDLSKQVPPVCDLCNGEDFLAQFIGKNGPFVKGENVDIIAGATYTSEGIINAVNAALPVAEPVEEPAAEPAVDAAPALTAAAPGFMGEDVGVSLTLNADGTIASIALDLSKQVPPVCDLCNGEDFLAQFIGKSGPFVKGENVDVIAGATYTSEGIINAVNAAMPVVEAAVEPTAEPTPEPTAEPVAEPAAEAAPALTAAAPGFMGADVGVSLTLNEDGTIAAIDLDLSKQVPPVCDLCNGEDFLAQFIGKNGPFVKGENVDIIAGATYTSEGIINAVNAALPVAEPVEEPAAEPAVDAAPALTAAAPGFMGEDVGVSLTLNEDGTIASIALDLSKQAPPVCDLCNGEDFLAQFIGKNGPFVKGENVDIIAGATYTSEGVINAVNAALPVAEPAAEPTDPTAPATITVPGYQGLDVTVTVTRDAAGAIAALAVNADTQSPGLGKKCAEEAYLSQFIGQTGPFTLGENIDAVSYATVTSQAIVDAVNALMTK